MPVARAGMPRVLSGERQAVDLLKILMGSLIFIILVNLPKFRV